MSIQTGLVGSGESAAPPQQGIGRFKFFDMQATATILDDLS